MQTRTEEIAWAAGLFEGEGCFTLSDGRPMIRVVSTDEETVVRFYEIVAAGRVYGPYQQAGNRKRFWVWLAYGIDALLVLPLLLPWLGERRRTRAREIFGPLHVPLEQAP